MPQDGDVKYEDGKLLTYHKPPGEWKEERIAAARYRRRLDGPHRPSKDPDAAADRDD